MSTEHKDFDGNGNGEAGEPVEVEIIYDGREGPQDSPHDRFSTGGDFFKQQQSCSCSAPGFIIALVLGLVFFRRLPFLLLGLLGAWFVYEIMRLIRSKE